MTTTADPASSIRQGVSNGISASKRSMCGIPVMKLLGIRLVQEMIKRLVIIVRSACGPEPQREQQILEEGLLSANERGDQPVFDGNFVGPVSEHLLAHILRSRGSKIYGPLTAVWALDDERQFRVDPPPDSRRLRRDESIEELWQQSWQVAARRWLRRPRSPDARRHAFGCGADIVLS